jgi:chromosome segregation ATPase
MMYLFCILVGAGVSAIAAHLWCTGLIDAIETEYLSWTADLKADLERAREEQANVEAELDNAQHSLQDVESDRDRVTNLLCAAETEIADLKEHAVQMAVSALEAPKPARRRRVK